MKPATWGLSSRLSWSSWLIPVLPMCGAVMVTIWPQYEGSVSTS